MQTLHLPANFKRSVRRHKGPVKLFGQDHCRIGPGLKVLKLDYGLLPRVKLIGVKLANEVGNLLPKGCHALS